MRATFAVPLLLIGLALSSQAGVTSGLDTFTPVSPQDMVLNFGVTTLSDGTTLPAFTLSFFFGYSLNGSNYPTPFTFKMDNSSINPNTSSVFSPPAFTNISAPALSNADKASWTFDAANSSLQLSNSAALFTIRYDPLMLDVIFTLDPALPLPNVPTPETVTESDNVGGPSGGTASGTLDDVPVPEPASLALFAAGLALLAGESWRRRRRA